MPLLVIVRASPEANSLMRANGLKNGRYGFEGDGRHRGLGLQPVANGRQDDTDEQRVGDSVAIHSQSVKKSSKHVKDDARF